MHARIRTVRHAVGIAAALLVAACQDSTGPAPPDVDAVSITAPRTTLDIGDSLQLIGAIMDVNGALLVDQPVAWSSSNSTVASVRASGIVSAHSGGEAMIRLASGGLSDSVRITVRPGACVAASATATIAIDERRHGTHTSGDCLIDGWVADGFRFDVTSPTVIELEVTSSSGALGIGLSDRQLGWILFVPNLGPGAIRIPVDRGSYVIWVTANQASGVLGTYELSVRHPQSAPCSVAAGSIATGQTIAGDISDTDCQFVPGFFADSWQLSLAADATVQIDLTSDEFDPVLLVTTAVGQWLSFNDDAGGTLNSQLILTLPAGEYFIVAATYSAGATGSYVLAVQPPNGTSPRRSAPATLGRILSRASLVEIGDGWPVSDKRSAP